VIYWPHRLLSERREIKIKKLFESTQRAFLLLLLPQTFVFSIKLLNLPGLQSTVKKVIKENSWKGAKNISAQPESSAVQLLT
jgi:hypothetical protein